MSLWFVLARHSGFSGKKEPDCFSTAVSSELGNRESVNCFQHISGTYKSALTGQFQLNFMFQGFNLLPVGVSKALSFLSALSF